MRSIILRLAPSAAIAGALAWCCWPYLQSDRPLLDPQGPANPPTLELDQQPQASGSDCERDPFRPLRALVHMVETAAAPIPVAGAGEPSAEPPPPVDPEKAVQRLTLNATLIRGRQRRAIIDGEAYEEGDPLPVRAGRSTPFLVEHIAAHQVTIQHHGRTYALRYRDALPEPRPMPSEHESLTPRPTDPNPQS
jgi:hypothetical protein